MPPPSRFGASKYRNAVPHLPSREEWYRGDLPASSPSSSASSISTFSSEIKTNRQWIVTLTPSGELSYRLYAKSDEDIVIGVGKVGGGGGVGDWDLSQLEGGRLVVGGLDGSISLYALPSTMAGQLETVHTMPASATAATNVIQHPTTPDLVVISTIAVPMAIYDFSSSSTTPCLTLSVTEPKGMWSTSWSPNGRFLAGIGRSGTAYIWDPRAHLEPVTTRSLHIQPLKPVVITWVGDDLFVTAFSKSRNREYHLFSGKDLSTLFTNTLDTSPGILIPCADHERRIVYLSGRGDMFIRQVELSGPMGYQESIHPLPLQLSSASLALAHPTTLPVMAAQIGTVLVPVVDKDGEAIVPMGIKVPRRQLIDYHEDLYPDILGTVPEQNAVDWLKGGDKAPLLISLDPARRRVWEKQLENGDQKSDTAPITSSSTHGKGFKESDLSSPTPHHVEPSIVSAASSTVATTNKPEVETSITPTAVLPPLQPNETHCSTSYKARIISHHIAQQLERHRNQDKRGPLMVGLQGPQGCGKTTLCSALIEYLQEAPHSLKIAVLSLDDLYKTNAGLKELASRHPDNSLLSGRGPPGTHDLDLAQPVLAAIQSINDDTNVVVQLPIFDKSLFGGEGDRSTDTVKISGPLDVFILEGWSVGFGPIPKNILKQRYENKTSFSDTTYFTELSLSSLVTLNSYLGEFATAIYPSFETIIQIEPESYQHVFTWRLEQERNMKAKNGGKGMSDEQVGGFVKRYMPGYELWKEEVWNRGRSWSGQGLRLYFGKEREVVKIDPPSGSPSLSGEVLAGDPKVGKSSEDVSKTVKKEATTEAKPSDITIHSKPFNPTWSRKFLSGKSPLIPTYDQVPSLSTLHQDSQILRCTPHLAFFPIQGTGGRLGVHPLKKKGRITTGGEGYLSGVVEIADFAVEMFKGEKGSRVAVAGEDGVIRVWTVGEDGVEGLGPEPEMFMKGQGIDKIAQIVFHPTAKDLLVLATNEQSSASLRFFDLSTQSEASVVRLDTSGIFNVTWMPDGSRVAVATKDARVMVLDPRESTSVISRPVHDSPRSFQLAWIDDTHIVSVGFSRGSQRCINLYEISSDGIAIVYSVLIDISPSVLFPVYDPGTAIMYVWGKGERQIQAYEVHPGATEPIAKLPGYTAGSPQLGVSYLPKKVVNVTKVEVAKALRLTARSIEEVSFSIPRNKPDFFQDDVYGETIDVEIPCTTAAAWLKGDNTPPKRISLQPEGMKPLSQAPQTNTKAKAKFIPAGDIMSEEEKKQKEMDALFAKAKMDESESEEEGMVVQKGLPPPDDDW